LLLQSILDSGLSLEPERQVLALSTFNMNLTPDLSVFKPLSTHGTVSWGQVAALDGCAFRVTEVSRLQVSFVGVSSGEASTRVTLVGDIIFVLVDGRLMERTLVSFLSGMLLQVTSQIAPHLEARQTVRTLVYAGAIVTLGILIFVLIIFGRSGRRSVDLGQSGDGHQLLVGDQRVVIGGVGGNG